MTSNPHLTDEQLRALVREAVARHLGNATPGQHVASGHHGAPASAAAGAGTSANTSELSVTVNISAHPSHVRYALSSGSSDDLREGPCLIEPAVTCNHCGYCQSHGH